MIYPIDAYFCVRSKFIKARAKKYYVVTSAKMCDAYKAYYEMPVGDQGKVWARHFTCNLCKRILKGKMESFASLHSGILKFKSFGILFNLNIFTIIFFYKPVFLKNIYSLFQQSCIIATVSWLLFILNHRQETYIYGVLLMFSIQDSVCWLY